MTRNRARKRAAFELIEREVESYHELKKWLDEEKMAIIESSPSNEVAVQSGPGDPTASKTIKLCSSKTILEIERRVNAIEYALSVVKRSGEANWMRLIELKYWDNRLTHAGIASELNISRATFHRWRRKFIELVADRLGWEV